MSNLVALLRGINVSGQKTIRMLELKALFDSLGFQQSVTYLQSGNVVFESADLDLAGLTHTIEQGIEQRFGFAVTVILRTQADFQRILTGNPFINPRGEDIEKLYVTFCASPPTAQALQNLTVPTGSADEFQALGIEIYLFCPGGYGRTRLSNNFFESKLNISATTRNWKTVQALAEISAAYPAI